MAMMNLKKGSSSQAYWCPGIARDQLFGVRPFLLSIGVDNDLESREDRHMSSSDRSAAKTTAISASMVAGGIASGVAMQRVFARRGESSPFTVAASGVFGAYLGGLAASAAIMAAEGRF